MHTSEHQSVTTLTPLVLLRRPGEPLSPVVDLSADVLRCDLSADVVPRCARLGAQVPV